MTLNFESGDWVRIRSTPPGTNLPPRTLGQITEVWYGEENDLLLRVRIDGNLDVAAVICRPEELERSR